MGIGHPKIDNNNKIEKLFPSLFSICAPTKSKRLVHSYACNWIFYFRNLLNVFVCWASFPPEIYDWIATVFLCQHTFQVARWPCRCVSRGRHVHGRQSESKGVNGEWGPLQQSVHFKVATTCVRARWFVPNNANFPEIPPFPNRRGFRCIERARIGTDV